MTEHGNDFPELAVPFSDLASPEARARFDEAAGGEPFTMPSGIAERRRLIDELLMIPGLEKMRRTFDVTIEERAIGGVVTDVVEPASGIPVANRNRVLVNLHGGGFSVGSRYSGQQEATSIAAVGGYRVVTVDYRMAPEYLFPAAVRDVESVYRQLLDDYAPENIGIYGCSAGSVLSAQTVAGLRDRGLPRPGGVGLFGAGALIDRFGDSAYSAGYLNGQPVPALVPNALSAPGEHHAEVDPRDPLVSPAYHVDVLRDFPPTLLVSGSRDFGLSPVLFTHARLVAAGVDARLHVWEGVAHCSFAQMNAVDPEVPEQRQIWNVIARFFDDVLGR